jgi:hypothetical protein
MAGRQERIDAFIHEGSPPADQPLEILCEDHVGTYVIPFLCQWTEGTAKRENTPTYRSRGDRLAGTKTKSALNLEVLSRSFAPVRDFLVFDDLPLIETAEAGSFDRRDVDKHISAAATLRLNEPIALGRIEPLHGAFRHYLLQATLRRAAIIARPKKKKGARRRPVSTGKARRWGNGRSPAAALKWFRRAAEQNDAARLAASFGVSAMAVPSHTPDGKWLPVTVESPISSDRVRRASAE